MLQKTVVCLSILCVVKATVFTIKAYEDENEIDNVVSSQVDTVRSCEDFKCYLYCRKMGYKREACIESDGFSEARSLEDCNLRWCEQNCRRIGFPGGVCVNGRCKCDILRSAFSSASQSDKTIDELSKVRSLEDCNLSWCEQSCRHNRFPGGVCINGRCKCDILRSAFSHVTQSDESSGGILETRSLEDCNLLWCTQTCKRIGFPGGVCVKGYCECDILRRFVSSDFADESLTEDNDIETDVNVRTLKIEKE